MFAWRAYQVVELDGGDALVHTRDDLLCDSGGIDMVRVKTVTQSRNSSCDFVELDTLFASICAKVSVSVRGNW
jgi:hypothetical protein